MENSIRIKLNKMDGCPSCISRIEKSLKKIDNVKKTEINSMGGEVTVKFDGETDREIKECVYKINQVMVPYEIKKIFMNGKIFEIDIDETKIENSCSDNCCGIDYGAKPEYIRKDIKIIPTSVTNPVRWITFLDTSMKIRTLRFALGLIIYIIAVFGTFPSYIELSLFIVGYLLFGYDIVSDALSNIVKGEFFDENFLMTVATLGAFAIGEYPEAVAVMLFFQIGEFLQDLAVEKSRKDITSLIDIKVETVNLVVGDDIKIVEPINIKVGDIILVKPGEKVPLDGVVIEGKSQIDASSLIGESVPRTIESGEQILSGVLNCNGLIKIEVTKDYNNSTVAKILDMVEHATAKKAPTERFITKFSKIYTPFIVFFALALAFVPPIFTPSADLSEWVSRALVFLVVSCPCALVVSVPLTFFSGIGAASKKGILVKGSNYMQLLSIIDTVVFDKTGTLTKGIFDVSKIEPRGSFTKDSLLELAYIIESSSIHPIAKSIVKNYILQGFRETTNIIENYVELGGMGVSAEINGKIVLAGNVKLMKDNNINFEEYDGIGTVVHISRNGEYAGYIVISDCIKDDSQKAIEDLNNCGVENIVMLTGDRKESAIKVAEIIGIKKVFFNLLPFEKVEKIEEIYRERPNSKVLFVGDGINDSPVLARSDVGIAMGAIGSDAAIEAADVVIMNDAPSKVAAAIVLAKNTMKIVRQNITFSLFVKFAVLIMATFGYANMWLAVFADVGVTLLVVLNSMRRK